MDSKHESTPTAVQLPQNLGIEISYDALEKIAKKAFTRRGEGVHWTCRPDQELPVKISLNPNDPASHTPITVVEQFQECCDKYGSNKAMRVERDGKWIDWTYEQYFDDSCRVAKALIKLGLTQFGSTVIMGFNCPEWFMANMGSIFAGGIASGIYTTNGIEATHYIADHCKAQVAFVENEVQTEKFLAKKSELPNLKYIVQWGGTIKPGVEGLMSWASFMQLGSTQQRDSELLGRKLQDRIAQQKPGNCCTLIYTSGTTGKPKAVMLSHDNVTWTARTVTPILQLKENERMVSYLPLSHIAAQLTDIHGPMQLGGTVCFAKPDALKGSLVETLQAVRPTIFLGVPRVWEKIEEKMRAVGAANTGLIKKIGDWAKGVGLEASRAKLDGKAPSFMYYPARKIVFDKIKAKLGLEHCKLCATAAAPISKKTLEYFMSLDLILHDLYGMSESSGPQTINFPGFNRYLYNPEATLKTIDENGWLHSGDLGSIDSEGYLRITGRIKELIITAGGENVPPVLIEAAIKAAAPALSNAVVIGDQRKFLSALLSLKCEVDANGVPTDTLMAEALALAKAVGSSATTVSEAIVCPKIKQAIERAISKVNQDATSRAQYIRKWTLIAKDFSQAGGELTPTMKLKRRVVNQKYAEAIEAMYRESKL